MGKAHTTSKDATAEVRISDAEFERFRDYFCRKTGIYFDNSKRYFVDKRLIERVHATGHESFQAYFTFMRSQASGEEFQQLVNLMTVKETYFFREEYQLKCMVESVLDEIMRHKGGSGDPLRIWSIPCSTGEEPYSIAIYLLEHWPRIDNVDIELVASDIDTSVLERARKGIYAPRSVQYLPKCVLEKYFELLPDGRYRISEDLRSSVNFCHVNLNDPSQTQRFRGFDLIYCRNLLIYFDDVSRRNAAAALYDALNPGGFLFLGHSESMSRITSLFKVHKFPDAIAYQKPI